MSFIDGLGILMAASVSMLGLIALMLMLMALFPAVTARAKNALVLSPKRAFFIGLANYVFVGGIALVLLNAGDILAVFGVAIFSLLAIISALGLAGLVSLLGERLSAMRAEPLSALKQGAWASAILGIATLALPFVGWFLILPGVLITAFGAAVLAWRNRKLDVSEQI